MINEQASPSFKMSASKNKFMKQEGLVKKKLMATNVVTIGNRLF